MICKSEVLNYKFTQFLANTKNTDTTEDTTAARSIDGTKEEDGDDDAQSLDDQVKMREG